MAFESSLDTLIENNRRYAAEIWSSDLPGQPSRNIAVVTCMDYRIDARAMLGIEPGGGALHA